MSLIATRLVAVFFAFAVLAGHLPAQQQAARSVDGAPPAPSTVAAEILQLAKSHAGDVAVSMRHLETGESFQYRGDRPQATASLIKLPIMIEAYRQAKEGKISLDALITLRAEDKVPGSGILTTHFSAGAQVSLRDAVRLMIAFSDNTATNLVLDAITLPATNETMDQWGYAETQVHSKVFRGDTSIAPERSKRFGLGSTTANDMVQLLAQLHTAELVSPAASAEMLAHLATCDDKLKFPALLPPGTKLAHKTGSVAKVRTDAGILQTASGPVALCVLTESNHDTRWSDDNAGDQLCAKIAKVVFDHFTYAGSKSEAGDSAKPLVLQNGATGDLVEALQRTLNASSAPHPDLSVDGDFGPSTEAAVRAFQRSQQLDATGIVDHATWQALGPLIMEEPPVPEPAVVNSEQLPKQPADDPSGPPAVTCKAWSIADADTGEVLWHERGDQPHDIASTTKIMTAYLVMRYCSQHSEALTEKVTFSERADKTPGSTAGVRAGESIPVGDLLYGLLLPSGNDASVALAEHFGARIDTAGNNAQSGYEWFITAMNRTAQQLEMHATRYANPHGLSAEEHRSSCNDLVRLSVAARGLPLFCQVTTCRQYGCRVIGEGGYQRNLQWKNTNQLLPIDGYTGIKTGSTSAAGACLVSSAARGDRELIVVVLGSASSAARYSDSRNLYAWAWRQLESAH